MTESALFVTDQETTVCFTGHRSIPSSVRKPLTLALDRSIQRLVSEGYTSFLCGGALGFDMLAEEAVIRARKNNPQIRLILVIPCAGQSSRWPAEEKKKYGELFQQADDCLVLSPKYYTGCMLTRNRYMVDRSSRCICYLYTMRGGTMSTVQYALQKQIRIDNLAMELFSQHDGMLKEDAAWNFTSISRSAEKNAVTALSHPFQIWRRRWNRMLRR